MALPTREQRVKGGKNKPKELRPDWAKFLVEDKVLRMGGVQKTADWLEKNHPEALVRMIEKFLPQHIVLGGDKENPLHFKAELPDDLQELIRSMRKGGKR